MTRIELTNIVDRRRIIIFDRGWSGDKTMSVGSNGLPMILAKVSLQRAKYIEHVHRKKCHDAP
jgi:hypothetical protein